VDVVVVLAAGPREDELAILADVELILAAASTHSAFLSMCRLLRALLPSGRAWPCSTCSCSSRSNTVSLVLPARFSLSSAYMNCSLVSPGHSSSCQAASLNAAAAAAAAASRLLVVVAA
jgi:hypothetical protein